MTASDYWRASGSLMRREERRNQDALPEPACPEALLTRNEFCTIAQRSFQAALKLSSMCSGRTLADLQASFHNSQAGATYEAEIEMDDEGSDGEGRALAFPLS